MKIYVNPSSLSFEGKNSKAGFSVNVDVDLRGHGMQKSYIGNYGYLSWHEINGKHIVRSPIFGRHASYRIFKLFPSFAVKSKFVGTKR
ncbi:hypothetical protein Scep_020269 [Stephania cephalantha]|uniref:Subtilisin-like protease fibronectin type-III domain-containing protein n=1 Tax=Stephania cephalantha TaxID=152367 RepID=A0AAP0NP45_9MAGN